MADQAVWLLQQAGTGVLCLAGVLVLVWISSWFDRTSGPKGR